jgi:replicative DNA helicase
MSNVNIDKAKEYELEVIANIIVNPIKINECNLEAKHFKTTKFRMMYPLIVENYKKNGQLDFAQLEQKMKGFMDFAIKCTNKVATTANIQYYIEKVQECYQAREYQKILNEYDMGNIEFDDIKSQINAVDNEFYKKGTSTKRSDDEILEIITKKDEVLEFDRFTLLPQKIEFIKKGIHVIGARPSVGKSALAINLFLDLSKRYKCVYLNMEMNEQKIYQRMVSCESGIPISRFKNLTGNELTILKNTIRDINSRNYEIMNGSKSVRGIRSIVSRLSKQEHVVLFIDYIGYVTTGKNQNDRERIGEAVRDIQLMTKDFDLTVFMLAQINRDGADSPTMNDLKDSGEIEQSAETIMLLHNPCVDLEEQNPIYNVFVPKNRGGQQSMLNLRFKKATQKFEEIMGGNYENRMY